MAAERKIVIITGESRGICAKLLNARRWAGYRTVGTCYRIRGRGDDLSEFGECDDSCLDTPERLGRSRMVRFDMIDLLANDAGVFIAAPSSKCTAADFAGIGLNLAGVPQLSQSAAVRPLRSRCSRMFDIIAAIPGIRSLRSRPP